MGFWDAIGDLLTTSALIGAQRNAEQQKHIARMQAQRIHELEEQIEDDFEDEDFDDDDVSVEEIFEVTIQAVNQLKDGCMGVIHGLRLLPDFRPRLSSETTSIAALTDCSDELKAFLDNLDPVFRSSQQLLELLDSKLNLEMFPHTLWEKIEDSRAFIKSYLPIRSIFQATIDVYNFLRVVDQNVPTMPLLLPFRESVFTLAKQGLRWPGFDSGPVEAEKYAKNFALALESFVVTGNHTVAKLPKEGAGFLEEFLTAIKPFQEATKTALLS